MSVLRSLLTAGVLASGLFWSLSGITATPTPQESDQRWTVTQSGCCLSGLSQAGHRRYAR